MAAKKKKTLEESFEEIERVLGKLEQEPVALEEAFGLYREGMELLKDCHKAIDDVEKKVLVLNGEGKTDEF